MPIVGLFNAKQPMLKKMKKKLDLLGTFLTRLVIRKSSVALAKLLVEHSSLSRDF